MHRQHLMATSDITIGQLYHSQ
uniref:Uncharacterized protein n=1 Tax=Arundo donax TaxID=35708 RepID=A0A0A8YC50_ARUDO